MATAINEMHVMSLLRRQLQQKMASILTEELVKEELERYEAICRAKIKPLAESVVIDGIRHEKDMLRMRDEVAVYLRWAGDNTEVEQEPKVTLR